MILNTTFIWSQDQAKSLISLLSTTTQKRSVRLKGERVLTQESSSNITLRTEFLCFIDSVMYPKEGDVSSSGNYWFNFWSPTDREAAGNFRDLNWKFFAQELHSICFEGKIEIKIKVISPGQNQTPSELKIAVMSDLGKYFI
jgi:hypothetical protein